MVLEYAARRSTRDLEVVVLAPPHRTKVWGWALKLAE